MGDWGAGGGGMVVRGKEGLFDTFSGFELAKMLHIQHKIFLQKEKSILLDYKS